MPLNLLKTYNDVLDLIYSTDRRNIESIRGVFNRDFVNEQPFFRSSLIRPTTAEGEDTINRLFRHLTTVITEESTNRREFDSDRSIRMHWIKYHLSESKTTNMLLFTVDDERRSYILDRDEHYVIVLEPSRADNSFFLLTAYKLMPSRYKGLMKKYEKRGRIGI
jgi:hypothetical protein